jgi:tungstate transport system ATP-binding protein
MRSLLLALAGLMPLAGSYPVRRPPAAEPLLPLTLDRVGFEAGGRTILRDVSLALGGRGITVLLGPNGAGKSVLLRLCNGLAAPTSGTVLWGGAPPDEPVRRRQSFVFQRTVLLRRSALANLVFVLRLRGVRDAERRALQVLERAGLAGLAFQPARRLSGGEQQRLAIARALATDPEVLLLDEPTASLDPASVAAIEALVRDAAAARTRVILVTHDVAQARRLADDVVFLAGGMVTEHTPAADFFAGPRSEAARAYLAGRLVL